MRSLIGTASGRLSFGGLMDRRSFMGKMTAALGLAAVAPSVLKAIEPEPVLPVPVEDSAQDWRVTRTESLPWRITRDFEIRGGPNSDSFNVVHLPTNQSETFSLPDYPRLPRTWRMFQQHAAYRTAKMADRLHVPLGL